MRILQVIPGFFPSMMWGGPPQNTLVLSRGLRARGHEVEILTTNVLDYDKRMSSKTMRGEWEGIPVTYLKSHWFGRSENSMGFLIAPDLWRYRRMLAEFDVIHIQGYRHFLFMTGSWLAQRYEIPYLVQARGTLATQFGRRGLKRRYDSTIGRYLLQRAAGVIALSQFEADEYRSLAVADDRISVIFNAFDPALCPTLPSRAAFRTRHNITPEEKMVLFLARLHERKGLDLLIEAFARVDIAGKRLVIVGPDYGFEQRARDLVAASGIADSTLFTGPLHGEDKYAAFRSADVYVLPSKGGEGLPTTVLEACYTGTPMLLTDTMEVADLIADRAGLVVPATSAALSAGLQRLLTDEQMHRRFQASTSSVLQAHFSLPQMLDQFEATYTNIVRDYTLHLATD